MPRTLTESQKQGLWEMLKKKYDIDDADDEPKPQAVYQVDKPEKTRVINARKVVDERPMLNTPARKYVGFDEGSLFKKRQPASWLGLNIPESDDDDDYSFAGGSSSGSQAGPAAAKSSSGTTETKAAASKAPDLPSPKIEEKDAKPAKPYKSKSGKAAAEEIDSDTESVASFKSVKGPALSEKEVKAGKTIKKALSGHVKKLKDKSKALVDEKVQAKIIERQKAEEDKYKPASAKKSKSKAAKKQQPQPDEPDDDDDDGETDEQDAEEKADDQGLDFDIQVMDTFASVGIKTKEEAKGAKYVYATREGSAGEFQLFSSKQKLHDEVDKKILPSHKFKVGIPTDYDGRVVIAIPKKNLTDQKTPLPRNIKAWKGRLTA